MRVFYTMTDVKSRPTTYITMSHLNPLLRAFLVAILSICIMTPHHTVVMAQRPLSANASLSANSIQSVVFTSSTDSTPTTTLRPQLRRVVNYAGVDNMNLGGNGHQSRPPASSRKITGNKSSANAIATLAQMAAGSQIDAAPDNPAYMQQHQQTGRVAPQRFPPSSALMALGHGRKHTFNELRRNMTQHKANWERQGEEPEYSLPMQPLGPDNPKDPIRVLKGVFSKDVSIIVLVYLH